MGYGRCSRLFAGSSSTRPALATEGRAGSAALRPGWFDRIFYVGLDLALRGTFAASVFHGAEYRRLFADVADVTYLTDQLSFYAGAAAGVEIKGRVLLGARFAWRFPRTFATYAPYFLPYTIDVDLGLRF